MSIRVEDEPHALLELLWVRDVHGLRPPGDVPPPLTDPPTARRSPADATALSNAWSELWHDAVAHLAELDPVPLIARIEPTAPGSDERRVLLEQLRGPTWRDRFGAEAFDASFSDWTSRRVREHIAGHRAPLHEHPERRALDALIPAWRTGLVRVIEIPCRGEFTRIAGPSALLVTAETRSDPERYAEALTVFAAHRRGRS
ncbi:hypothetical protein LXM50_05910 [Microbacterium sp. Au-Mic1]|uniref:hypothetical protein n=1 Tax=Microbacterium sp. Au-Mic1 TaxID=2906457 RepID=UPI001E4EE167|nr:hypothetical protein [Microbacterium sp. Au-Mic1]MCE4025502.1 hypothetical protein [Microbacterium sp. Au-Mic1]